MLSFDEIFCMFIVFFPLNKPSLRVTDECDEPGDGSAWEQKRLVTVVQPCEERKTYFKKDLQKAFAASA